MELPILDDAIHTRGPVQWVLRDSMGRFIKHGIGRNLNKTNNNALAALVQYAIGVPNVSGFSNTVPYPTQMQLGTGSGTPSSTDSGLFTPTDGTLIAINNWSIYQTFYAQYQALWDATTPAGNYTEAALLDANSVCWAHVLLQTSANQPYVPIQSGQSLTIIWKLQLLGN